jgi:ABC-type multidrug transport system fused ATPase/permease subunit
LGKRNATDEEINSAANAENAHDFMMELPENYDTSVGPMRLSGRQKLQICISREILVNCPILLLDEATAALDTESEQLIQKSLEEIRHGKTATILTRRLTTVKHADRIGVLQEGRVVETGTHDELLARSGIYADLIKFRLELQ